jgi:hypothetical protein
MMPFWITTSGTALAQGDFLRDCLVPSFKPDFRKGLPDEEITVAPGNLIIVTQSCDLENAKVQYVALCPIHTLTEFESINPHYRAKGRWEEVRKGRVEGLHMLACPERPDSNREALVVDFRQIISLPFAYLSEHANSLGQRWRLQSPFLEHFSQAFARFFMRVGLPSSIPAFK